MMVLYDYFRSSAAYRLRIALNMLGQEYDTVPVNLLTGEHRGAENLARNKQGLVPTLEIDGQVLTQSLAILEYLNEVHSANLLPAEPLQRARVRALSYAIAMEIHPVCNLSVAKYAVEHSGGNITMQGWMQAFIPKGLAAFEAMLDHPETGDFCHGNTVTMADICLVPQVYNARRWEVDLADMPRITAIMERLEHIDAITAAHPDRVQPDT